MHLDPRDFVRAPFVDCPTCGQRLFGVVTIGPTSITRRCRECMKAGVGRTLPPLARKTTVFLDQSVLSNFAKVLNPRLQGHARAAADPRWLRLFRALSSLVNAQELVCPIFETHEDESAVSPFPEELRTILDALSGGHAFKRSSEILHLQLLEAAAAQREPRLPDFESLRESCVEGDLRAWADRIRITAHVKTNPESLVRLRKHREQGHEQLIELHTRWRGESSSFRERYEFELTGLIEASKAELLKVQRGALPSALVRTIDAVATVLLGHPPKSSTDAHVVLEFLRNAGAQVPYNRFSAALYAGMGGAASQSKPPNQGTFSDLTALTALALVSDLHVVDNGTFGLIKKVKPEYRLPVDHRVFSTNSIPELTEHLERRLAQISIGRRALLAYLYGPNWSLPMTKLFD